MSGFRKAAERISDTLVALSEPRSSAASHLFEALAASDTEDEGNRVDSKSESCLEYLEKTVRVQLVLLDLLLTVVLLKKSPDYQATRT